MSRAANDRPMWRVMAASLGWGGGMAAVRMVTSFVSIKVTAVYLGPAGLALVAQFSNFISLMQSMLGQGLTTGIIQLSAACGDNEPARRRIYGTAWRMGLALVAVAGLLLVLTAPLLSAWLLTDRSHTLLIAVAGLAVAAAMVTDLFLGSLSVTREISLIGLATIGSTVLGLLIFAPSAYLWGINGGLWASFAVLIASALLTTALVRYRSRGVRLSDFFGPFDREACRRLIGFYPMLLVNGVLPPLTLILVRDTLVSLLGLDQAGLWQATWRLSEAYQAAIISATALYFMPSMGERLRSPPALRLQLLRTLAMASGCTAALAVVICALREPIVHIVFSPSFRPVSELMPLQLVGDVLKMAGWILSMSLVATVRTRTFIAVTVVSALVFVGLTKALVPQMGLDGVLFAYVACGATQVVTGLFGLRSVLWLTATPVTRTVAVSQP
ncbi:MAG: oligosaccharide flippase family protein [Leptothrix sp. (in: b-proteobacteria)]